MIKKIMNVLSVALLVILVLAVMFFFASRIMGEVPSVFGNYIFRVSSDSMEPTLKVGDVILVRSEAAEDIHKDDIITYKSKDGSMYGREVTHRVVTEPEEKNGTYYYQTQGDAPNAPLDKKITYDQIQGKYVRTLTLFGKVFNFFTTPTGIIVFIGIIIVLFGYEMIALFASSKKLDETDDLLFDSIEKALPGKDTSKKENPEKKTSVIAHDKKK